jgi:Protein of unknown function (DUF3592)
MLIGGGGIYITWRGGTASAGPTGRSARRVQPAYVLVPFFSLFLLMGGAISYLFFVRPVLNVEQARNWPAVACRIISSRVQSHSGKSTTYSIDILYAYNVDGREYRSNRYDFMGGSSGGYGGKAEIVSHYPPGATGPCYVNPHDPTEAVLERSLRPTMLVGLFPLVFLFLGAGGLVWVLCGGGRGPKLVAVTEDAPPWMCRQDWASGRIISSSKPAMIGAWVFSGLWNLISLPFAVVLLNEWMRSGDGHLLPGFLFPALGLVLFVWARRLTTRWRRFGDSVFEMTSVPGVVGGALEGTIRLSQPLRAEDGFQVTLMCVNRVTTGAGKDRSTVEHVLWKEDQRVNAAMGDRVPVAFYVPPDCRETNSDYADNVVIWRLKATAKEAGVGYASKFEVPMFQVAQTPQQVAAAKAILSRERAEIEHYQPSAHSRIRVQPAAGGGQEFYFPAMRNVGSGVGLTFFFVFWSAIFWLLVHEKAPLVFPIFWGVSDLLVFVAVLHFLTGTTRVVADASGLTVTKRLVGIRRTRVIPAGAVTDIKAVIGMTSGQTAYQNITVVCQDGRKITAGSAIKDSQEAQWLAAQMVKCVRSQR